jgi:hypothetical protein
VNYNLGSSIIDEIKNRNIVSYPSLQNDYVLEIYTKDLLLKKNFQLGFDKRIISLKYEKEEKGCLNASIEYMNFDVLLEYDDIVIIKYKGNIDYIGYITSYGNYDSGTIKIDSFINKLNQNVYKGDFIAQTKRQILETIIDDTQFYYNDANVDIIDTDVYTVSYESVKHKKIIEDWAEKEQDRFWGIDENRNFFVKQKDSIITQNIYPKQYEGIKYTKDWSKIKFTRLDLYRRKNDDDASGDPDEIYVCEMPDGSTTYPYFEDTENIIGIIKDKKVAPDELTGEEVKRWAYGEIQAQIKPVESIDITGLKRSINLIPGQKVRVYEISKKMFTEIELTDLNNWEGNVSLSTDGYRSANSVLITGNTYLTFAEPLIFTENIKIVFFVKSDYIDTVGSMTIQTLGALLQDDDGITLQDDNGRDLADDIGDEITAGNIIIQNVGLWNYIEFILPASSLRSINFTHINDFKIDYMFILAPNIKYYEMNVLNVSFDISADSMNKYDVKLGCYDKTTNDIQFEMERLIEKRTK